MKRITFLLILICLISILLTPTTAFASVDVLPPHARDFSRELGGFLLEF